MVGAFADIYGRSDVFEGVNFGGMTDRAIARHGVVAAAGACDDAAIDRALAFLDEAGLSESTRAAGVIDNIGVVLRRRALTLSAGVLAIALADESRASLALQPVALDRIVRDVVLQFMPRADRAGVDLGARARARRRPRGTRRECRCARRGSPAPADRT